MKAKFKSATSFACALTVLALAIPAVSHAQYYMTANDANGATTSFNGAGNWNNGPAPSAGNTYTTDGWLIRVPNVTGSYTFAGDSLTIGGTIASGATAFSPYNPNNDALIFKANGESATVNNLILDGGQVRDGDASGNNAYLYGNIYVTANGGAFMAQETNWINSAISGDPLGTIYIGSTGSENSYTRWTIFTSGANTFTGNLMLTNMDGTAAHSLLNLYAGSLWNFNIGLNGVNNSISGIGTLQLNGNFAFDLSGADNTIGDSWQIVAPATSTFVVTYGSTFAVNGFTQNGSLWDGIANGVDYEYNTADGILSVVSYVLVINTADSGAGSLRAALAYAANGDTIDATGVSGVITLTTGQLNVANSVTILGPGPGTLTVSGNNASGVFNVTGSNVAISGLTIANGYSTANGAGINAGGGSGSVLDVSGCVITNNSTSQSGGGIYNGNGITMTISNCTISGNYAYQNGGGIYNSNATLTINASTFSGNSTYEVGGGVMNYSLSGNAALTIDACTFSSNSAWSGGGIVNYCDSGSATLTINASTLSGNSAASGDGGGIQNVFGTLMIGDTILNAGAAGGNIYNYSGTVTSDGYNLSSDAAGGDSTTGPGGLLNSTKDIRNTNPLLGPLQNNGGPTWTCALLPGSPAIDAGKCNAITNLVCATDQRGYPRVVILPDYPIVPGGDGSDIGAYELQWDPARPGFNTNGAGWYLNGDTVNGGPNITNNVFTLTDGTSGENRSAWFSEPLYVGGFQASFTYQDIGGGGADGTAFIIQNDPSGTAALGLSGGGLGYVGITPSVAVLLNIFFDSPGGAGLMLGTNGVGAYYPSGVLSGMSYQSTAPVNLAGGNPIAVGLRYTGGMLYASFTDTATSNQFQTIIPVDIPAFVGTNAAWVGFTGSEGGTTSHQIVSNFSYRPLPTLTIRQSQPPSLVFTWPAAVYGFTLQSNSSLNNPAGWTSVAGTSTQTNGLNQVTTPSPTSTQFYRLVLPGGP
jgi:hypothetical protein